MNENENTRPVEQENSIPIDNAGMTPAQPVEGALPNMPSEEITTSPVKKKSKKKAIALTAIIAASVLVIFALWLFIPIIGENAVENSISSMLSETKDFEKLFSVLEKKGIDMETTMMFSRQLTDLDEDLTVDFNLFGKDTWGSGALTLTARDKSYSLAVDFNEDQIGVKGLSKDGEEYISFPLKNAKEAIDNSVFHPDSGSAFALSKEDYDELMELLDHDETELNSLEKDLKKIKKECKALIRKCLESLDGKSEIYFAEGKFALCRRVTYILDKDASEKLIDALCEGLLECKTLEEYLFDGEGNPISMQTLCDELKKAKDSLEDDMEMTMGYVISGGKIVELFSEQTMTSKQQGVTVDASVVQKCTLEYGRKKKEIVLSTNSEQHLEQRIKGIKVTADVTSEQTVTISATDNADESSFSIVTYAKIRQRNSQNLKWVTEEGTSEIRLVYDKDSHEYTFDMKNDEDSNVLRAKGEYYINPSKGELKFTMNYLRSDDLHVSDVDIIKIDVKPVKDKKANSIENSRLITDMTEEQLKSLLSDLNVKGLEDVIYTLTKEEIFVYSVENAPVLKTETLLNRGEHYRDLFYKYEDECEKKGLSIENVAVYDKDFGLYFLISSKPTTVNLDGYAYLLTEDILKDYHPAVVEGTKLKVHELTEIRNTPSTCLKEGETIYHCSICNEDVTAITEKVGHYYEKKAVPVEWFENSEIELLVEECKYCGYSKGADSASGDYEVYLIPDENGNHTVGSITFGHLKNIYYIPSQVYNKYRITDLEQNKENYKIIAIPEGVEVLKDKTFSSSRPEILVIPSTVKEIQAGAFNSLQDLYAVFYAGTKEQWNKISNAYENDFKRIDIKFKPNGVTIKDIENAKIESPSNSQLDKLEAASRDLVSLAGLKSNEKVTFIDEFSISDIAYDSTNDFIIVLTDDGQKSELKIYKSSGELVKTFSLDERGGDCYVNGGYAVVSPLMESTSFHLFDLSQMTMEKIELYKRGGNYVDDSLCDIRIVSGKVYAVMYHRNNRGDTNLALYYYDISEKKTVKVKHDNMSYYCAVLVDHEKGYLTLAELNTVESSRMLVIDCNEGNKIVKYVSVPYEFAVDQYIEGYLITKDGKFFDHNCSVIEEVPDIVINKTGTDRKLYRNLYADEELAVSVMMYKNQKFRFIIQKNNVDYAEVIDGIISAKAVKLNSGDLLIGRPGGKGVLIYDMP